MSLLNHSTTKEAEDTIGEIQRMLSNYGVSAMMTEYYGRQVSAVSFRMNIDGREMSFRMPCNWRGVFEILKYDMAIRPKFRTEEQAVRVAWRIIHTWFKAQLALVEVNMVTIPQIFLPYTIMGDNRTLAEHVTEDPRFLLGPNQ